jgi:hypothetical protein
MSPHTPTTVSGFCLCKLIHYTLTLPPLGTSICHCTYCQRTSGSAFSANVYVSSSAFTLNSGDEHLSEFTQIADSGDPIRRNFCKVCGTFVFSREASGDVTVPSGGLDVNWAAEGEGEVQRMLRPRMEVFIVRKRGWLKDLEGVEAWEGMPPVQESE